MTQATINGNTYSDDGTSPKDMLNGGHRTHFLPMVSDVATVAGVVAIQAAQTAIDAANAANGAAATRGTSTTSLTVAAGSKSITTQAGKQFVAGNYVTISRASDPATLMHGVVTAYNSGTGALTVSVAVIAGSGTFSDWTIALSGAQGATGATGNGNVAYAAKTAAYTLVPTDRGSLIDCTTGTFTLSFNAAATLGANWATFIRNSGTGVITLDPSGAETIDGAATVTVPPGCFIGVQCDGSVLRTFGKNSLQKLPIFSAAAALVDPVSSNETLALPISLPAAVDTLCSNGSMFVGSLLNNSAVCQSSPDGTTWTNRTLPITTRWAVESDGSGFLAVCTGSIAEIGNEKATAYSAGGTSWASATVLPDVAGPTYTTTKNTFAAISGRYLLRGRATTSTLLLTVNNGTSWTTQTAPAAALTQIIGSGGLFVANLSGSTYYTSATGVTGSWTTRTMPGSCTSLMKDYDGSLIAYATGVTAYKSTDGGVNWTSLGFVAGGDPASISGVYFWATAYPYWMTQHKSAATQRYMPINTALATKNIAKAGSKHLIGKTGSTSLGVIDTAVPATAFFA